MTKQNVSTPHPDSSEHLAAVKKVRDFIYGRERVKPYILTLPGQEAGSLDAKQFADRAYYLPAISRTLDAFVGMVMSNGAKAADLPKEREKYAKDITNDGEPLSGFSRKVVTEVITAGRCAVLADYPDRPDANTLTKRDAELLKLRPYAKLYKTEDVINWQIRTVDGQRILSQLRLMESYEEAGEDEWSREVGKQIRVCDLDPVSGVYRVRIYRQATDSKSSGKSGSWQQFGADRYPIMNGQPLTYIPAIVFGPTSLDPSELERPPLEEMADIACAHLQNSAGAEWSLMWCGCTTLTISGEVPLDGNGKPIPIRIGSSSAIYLGEGGEASLLQAGADAVGALKTAMDDKRKDMAAIGARILIDSGSSNISTETAKLERVGEHSVLSAISNSCADGMSQVLQFVLMWDGMDETSAEKVRISLNTDFVPKGMQIGELTEWVKAVQSGLMPLSLYFQRLKSRGEVPDDMTEDQFRDELDKDADQFMPAMPVEESPPPDDQLQQQAA